MLVSPLLLTFLFARSVFPAPNQGQGRVCGNSPSDDEVIAAEIHFAEQLKYAEGLQRAQGLELTRLDEPSTNITVYWHVIQKGENAKEGHITQSDMDAQIEVLNTAYRQINIQFTLNGSDYTTNADWFDHLGPDTPQNTAAKQALRKGDKAMLNIYSTGFERLSAEISGIFGYAPFPSQYENKPYDDGVVFLWSTVPGGALPRFNHGFTLVHEIGHWLGLYHTYQGGCNGLGDGVSDTPAEASNAFGCPIGRDTCPHQEGEDPIHNFMDFSDDECLDSFTAGQGERIRRQISVYRGIK